MSNTSLEHLKAARALLAVPGAFIKNTFAKDANDAFVHWGDASACKFCMMGALRRTAPDGRLDTPQALREVLGVSTANPSWVAIPAFNDASGTTQDGVLAVFDKAIALEEARG